MEKIIDAAVRLESKTRTGRRHAQIMREIWNVSPNRYISQDEEGFVTDSGRFVDRKEAAEIAFRSGQIPQKKEKLFSEDVW